MKQTRHRKFRPTSSKSHAIGNLISAPLVAAAKANSLMQKQQTKFLMEVGFEEKNGAYEPRMVEMILSKPVQVENEDGTPSFKMVHTTFSLPLLTIVPINSLAVDNVNVEFEMELTEQITREKTSQFNPDSKTENPQTELKGKISYDSKERRNQTNQYKRQNSSSLKVEVHAGTLPLPVGVNTLLDLYVKAIQPVEVANKKEKDHSQ